MRIWRTILRLDNKKLFFVAGIATAVLSVIGSFGLAANRVSASGVDCDNNAIIYCGFSDAGSFISKVKKNVSGNGHNDLQSIYNYFGLSSSEYDDFAAHAQSGYVYRDGHITVNGVTVANGAKSVGRLASYHGSDATKYPIGSSTYYGNIVDKTFASGVNSLPIYAMLDSFGNLKFAVMKACGNPTFGSNVKTSASCTALNMTPATGKANTYNFTATAAHTGNAKITKYVYSFGDGATDVETDGSKVVTHTYTKPGTYSASVTVYASVPGNNNLKLATVATCIKKVTITLPACVQLVGAILDKTKLEYSFTVTASAPSGATFTGADFDFGDGKSQNGVKPATATTATVTHTYASGGQYNAAATVHFSMNGGDYTAPTCKALVTPENVTPECKPGVPVGSAECSPCKYDSSLPSDSDQCVPPPPPSLPNTGAGNTIAIFAAVMVAGFLVYRQLLFKKHRAAFAAAEQGTSPLPLGDPMSDNPLQGTPLAGKKRGSFRRRQF